MDAIHFLFHGLCHQMESRALSGGGVTMPLCARCAGMFAAFAVALPFFLLRARSRAAMPAKAFAIAAGAALLAYAADGAANVLGMLDTPGAARLASGALAGAFLSAYIAALWAATLERRGGAAVAGVREAAAIAAAALLLSTANVRPPAWLMVAESYAAAAGALLFVGVVHAAILTLVWQRGARAAAAVAVFTAPGQLALFAVLRKWAGF